MMICRIPGATRNLGAPADWDGKTDPHCSVLPILDHQVGGRNVMTSAWEPTPEELAALNAGAKILLSIFGTGHPVVSLGVGEPPEAGG
jgi:hypothetical protein